MLVTNYNKVFNGIMEGYCWPDDIAQVIATLVTDERFPEDARQWKRIFPNGYCFNSICVRPFLSEGQDVLEIGQYYSDDYIFVLEQDFTSLLVELIKKDSAPLPQIKTLNLSSKKRICWANEEQDDTEPVG